MAVIVFAFVHWQKSKGKANSSATTPNQELVPRAGSAAPTPQEAQALRRELLAEVETKGLAALSRIDATWPDSLRKSLRRQMLEHHGIHHPLESLDWLVKNPRIEGSEPLGVELTSLAPRTCRPADWQA